MLKCCGTCCCWKLWTGTCCFYAGGLASWLSAWCCGVYTVAVTATSPTGGLTGSSSVGCHFLLFGGGNSPVKGVAFASVVLKRSFPLLEWFWKGGSFMPYGLAKGVSSVVDFLDGGSIFIFKLGMLSTICTDLLDGFVGYLWIPCWLLIDSLKTWGWPWEGLLLSLTGHYSGRLVLSSDCSWPNLLPWLGSI